MNAAAKKPTAKKLVKHFRALGFCSSEAGWMDADDLTVWTLDAAQHAALKAAVEMVAGDVLEVKGTGSSYSLITKRAGMLVPPQRRPFA